MANGSSLLLKEKLQDVRHRIQRIKGRSESISEADTKAALIEPLFDALGWAMTDFEVIKREYRHNSQDNPVDYALFINRVPSLFVEAKGLRENMNDRKWITQTVNYANAIGVKWCVLTNGEEYRLYNSHAECDVEEKQFTTIKVTGADDDVVEVLDLLSKTSISEKRLDALWKTHFIDRHVQSAIRQVLDGDDSFIRLVRKYAPELTPSEIRDSLNRAQLRVEYPPITIPSPRVVIQPATTSIGKQAKSKAKKALKRKSPAVVGVEVHDLIKARLIEAPLEVEKEYKDHHLKATILPDGRINYLGTIYESVSTAAAMARKDVIGASNGRKYPQTNGWKFWKWRNPTTGNLEEIDSIRQQFLQRKSN